MAPDTAFYDQRAASYAAASHDMDLRPLYARFLPHVRPGGLILDAGCGSGRDALAFRQAGFRVEAFDASPQMARQAALLLGQEVPVLCFEDVAWQERFDGIWACASLLHVAPADLPDVLRRLQRALRPGGVMFFISSTVRGSATARTVVASRIWTRPVSGPCWMHCRSFPAWICGQGRTTVRRSCGNAGSRSLSGASPLPIEAAWSTG